MTDGHETVVKPVFGPVGAVRQAARTLAARTWAARLGGRRGVIEVTGQDRARHAGQTDLDIVAMKILNRLTVPELLRITRSARGFEALRHGVALGVGGGLPHPHLIQSHVVRELLKREAISHQQRKDLSDPRNWPA